MSILCMIPDFYSILDEEFIFLLGTMFHQNSLILTANRILILVLLESKAGFEIGFFFFIPYSHMINSSAASVRV